MRDNKLAARRKKAFRPRTTLAGQRAAPNLIKDLAPGAPDQISRERYHLCGNIRGLVVIPLGLSFHLRGLDLELPVCHTIIVVSVSPKHNLMLLPSN
jgi:hypothetical protein